MKVPFELDILHWMLSHSSNEETSNLIWNRRASSNVSHV